MRIVRVALTVWEGRISPVFDTAQSVLVVDLEKGNPISRHNETLHGDSVQEKIEKLRALGVETLVCGAVSRPLADWVKTSGIRLFPFVSGDLDDVLDAVATGRIPDASFSMPGCGCRCTRRVRRRRSGNAGNGRKNRPQKEKT